MLGNNLVQSNKGIRVTANNEVTVYGINQLQYSTDAFLALPVDILNRNYLVLSHSGGFTHNKSQFAIIAPYDGTVVTIIPSVTAGGHAAGVPYTINLNRFDTYQLQASGWSADLSGTEIVANNPIAVFAGNECDNLPGSPYTACDHNVEQLFPEASWGTSFITFPLATRTGGDTFRIIASADNTTVDINGDIITLNRGAVDDRIITTSSVISADNPIMVAQYSNSSTFDGVTSDPFMMLIPPFEQFLTSYTFTTPSSGIIINYVNVVLPSSAVSGVVLDGLPVPAASFTPIGTSGYSGAALPLSIGSHSITCSEACGISSYGFNSYDSYGYPGGLALEFIYPRGDANLPLVTGAGTDCQFIGTAVDNTPSEDVNDNGILDPGEDLNGNNQIDEDTGIFLVELDATSINLLLNVDPFVPGTFNTVNFTVSLVDPNSVGSGRVVVTDGAGNSDNIIVNIDCRATVCQDIEVECTQLNPCDIIQLDNTCPSGVEVSEEAVIVEPQAVSLCGGEDILISHHRLGSYIDTQSSSIDVCGGDCQNVCVASCIDIPLQSCYNTCIRRCSNGLCMQWDTVCNVTGLQTVCDQRCVSECEDNFDAATQTSFFNRTCGHEILDQVEVRQSDGTCSGSLISSRTVRGAATASINLSAHLLPGNYDLCLNGDLIKSFAVQDCGAACRINIHQNRLLLNQGVNASLPFEVENIGSGGTYSLSVHRFEDDAHTIPLSVPSFISLPSSASVSESVSVSLNINVNDPQPEAGQWHWANIIVRAEGPSVCEGMFDLTIAEVVCGNATIETGEECDDGNTLNGDGCSANCTLECVPSPETCNGLDDDCNGHVDDGIAPVPTECGVGACTATGQSVCVSGQTVDTCTPGTPQPEVCNGIDDDCDGTVPSDEADADSDGYRICQSDCDDTNASINPGMSEVKHNNMDDDCNPLTLDNTPPDVSGAYPSIDCIWPPNNKFVNIIIKGVTDDDGDAVSTVVNSITSDEPTASIEGAAGAKHSPDASGIGTGTAGLRAERSGKGNGRVYEVSFTANDGYGGAANGSVTVKVPHDMSGTCNAVNDGQKYDATKIN